MQTTITTRYSGPTDTRGSRVTARTTINGSRRFKTIPFDYAAGAYGTHEQAAHALAAKLGLGKVYDAEDGTPTGWRFRAEAN